MRGHLQILTARRKRRRPEAVFVNLVDTFAEPTNRYDEPENGLRHGFFPQVFIERQELRRPLDLRYLFGLSVHVHGETADDDMYALLDMIEEHQPDTLVACAGDTLMFRNYEGWKAWIF